MKSIDSLSEQLQVGHMGAILLEPVGRNTAPVVFVGLSAGEEDPLP